jgi:hypothetical protein
MNNIKLNINENVITITLPSNHTDKEYLSAIRASINLLDVYNKALENTWNQRKDLCKLELVSLGKNKIAVLKLLASEFCQCDFTLKYIKKIFDYRVITYDTLEVVEKIAERFRALGAEVNIVPVH